FSLKTNNKQVEKIRVFDVNGRLIKTFSREQEHYSISELNNGVYFVSIKLNNGELIKKLIKY
ncbi:MAG TPA: T9SS type A sorting domain-containing protein, partial [Saprospiraceae bacterium]|nr:T9SS type A sorting domain-containing protein [Saprospiraceae bacterium]